MESIILSELDVPGAYFDMDPENYSVIKLKRWLECHGVKRTGKKQQLIDNVRGAIQAKTPVDPKAIGILRLVYCPPIFQKW